MDSNQLNQQNIDHKGTQDDPNDPFQFSNLEKLAKIAKYNITTSGKEPIKTFLGIVLKAEWVPSLDDGFTEKDLVNINSPNGQGAYKCIVRIPEVHSCIPEPKQPALQDPNNKTGEPNFDDFYVLMHDDFYVDNVSGYKSEAMPQPGDIVVCDYKYRDVRLGGVISGIHPKAGAAGGVNTDYVSNKVGTGSAFDNGAKKGQAKTSSKKEIDPKYVGKLQWEQKLEVLHPRIRQSVDNILNALTKEFANDERFDANKILLTSTWRDANKQSELYRGKSPTNYSYHIVITDPSDSDYYKPVAYAADISYPGRPGKGVTKAQTILQEEFYAKLGKLVKQEGLSWGGDYSKAKVKLGNYGSYAQDRLARTGISWDPQHMVMKNLLNKGQKRNLEAETKRIYKDLGQTEVD